MKLSTTISLSVASLCAGFLLSSAGLKSNIALAAATALPTAFITYLVSDSKAQAKVNESLKLREQAGKTLHKSINDFNDCKSRLGKVSGELESLKGELAQARNTINSLGLGKLQCVGECEQLRVKVSQLNQTVKELELDKEGDAGKITYYQELTNCSDLQY
jgi:chromosome segregation ATPase